MTDEEIDKKYKEFDAQIRTLINRRDSLEDQTNALQRQLDALYDERDAWERTL